MKFTRSTSQSRLLALIAAVLWCVMTLFSCDNTADNADLSADNGSVSFSISYGSIKNTLSDRHLMSTYTGIARITAYILHNGRILAQGSWSSSEHQGTLTNIRAGNGYALLVYTENNQGDILFYGRKDHIDIIANQTTRLDTPVILTSFLPVVSAESSGSGITLSWNPIEDVSSYNIYWSDQSGLTKTASNRIRGLTDSSFVFEDLIHCTPYYFAVTAVYGEGESLLSFEAHATIGSVPSEPEGLDAIPGDGEIMLSWINDTHAEAYTLSWGTSPGVYPNTISDITASSYTHTGLTNCTAYYYVVTAENNCGMSVQSNELAVTPGDVPSRPANLTPVTGDRQILIRWDSTENADSYTLSWGTSPGEYPNTISDITASSYTHTGLTNCIPYYYVVTAENDCGESIRSSELSAIPGGVPSQPADLTAVAGDGQILIRWNSDVNADSYTLSWGTSPGEYPNTISNLTASSFTHAGLTNCVSYYYVVTAINNCGQSVLSSELIGIPGDVPSQPANLTAVSGDGQILIRWDNDVNADSYTLSWGRSPGSHPNTIPGITASSYRLTNLENCTAYYYVVTAENNCGQSVLSSERSAIPGDVPSQPADLTAVSGDGQILIRWNSDINADSYTLSWGTSQGEYPNTISDITASSYTHVGLTNCIPYYYVVIAENNCGQSVLSNELTATPGDAPPAPVNISAEAADDTNTIFIAWDSVEQADYYDIYWGTSSGSYPNILAGGITGTSYTHTDLINSTSYFYIVRAVNDCGESPDSVQAEVNFNNITINIDENFQYIDSGFPMGLSTGQTSATGLSSTPYERLVRQPEFSSNGHLYGYFTLGNSQEDNRYSFVVDEMGNPTWVLYVDINNNEDLTDDGPPLQNQGTGRLATIISFPNIEIITSDESEISRPYQIWFFINEDGQNRYPRFYSRCHYRSQITIGGQDFVAVAFETSEHDALYFNNGLYIDVNQDGLLDDDENFQNGDPIVVNRQQYRVLLDFP